MTSVELERIKTWFAAYAQRWIDGADGLATMLVLKRDHTLRVVENSESIALELGWPDLDIAVGSAIGWLHDVGRFPQLVEFRTLSDRQSINHAQRSCEVIDAERVLDGVSATSARCIREAILAHNQAEIPATTPPEALRFAKLIRDADKLDIYTLVRDALWRGTIEGNPEIVLNVSFEKKVNPEILERVRSGQSASYDLIRTLCDFFLVQMAWIRDINYKPTLRRMRDERILETLAAQLPDTPAVRETVAAVMNEFIALTAD